jgi:hypothetical protein
MIVSEEGSDAFRLVVGGEIAFATADLRVQRDGGLYVEVGDGVRHFELNAEQSKALFEALGRRLLGSSWTGAGG